MITVAKQIPILLVEDDLITATVEKQELEKYGYTVTAVHSGEAALRQCGQMCDFVLILMDIDLGEGIDGTEAARQIQEIKEIPVLFLSSHTEPEIVEKTEKITSYGYVVKNSGITVIDASIKMALKLFKAKQDIKRANEEVSTINKEIEAINEELITTNEMLEESQIQLEQRGSALQETNLLLLATMNGIPDPIGVLSTDYRVLQYNQAGYEMLGVSPAKADGKKCYQLVGRDSPCELCAVRESLKTGNIEEIERYEESIKRWVNLRAYPMKDDQGKVYRVIEHFQDITERKNASLLLQESEEKYRNIFENSPLGLFRSTPEGRFLEVNKALARMLGYNSPEKVIESIYNIAEQIYVRPDERQPIVSRQLQENGASHHVNYYRRQNGEEFIANLYLSSVRDDKGNVLYLEGIVEDITEDEYTRMRLKQYEEIFKNASWGIAVGGAGETLDLVNPAYANMHGYTVEECRALPLHEMYAPSDKDSVKIHRQKAVEQGHYRFQSEHKRKDGTTFPALIDVTVSRDAKGRILHRIANVQDITELKSAQEKAEHINRILQGMKGVLHEIVHVTDKNELIQNICTKLVETQGYHNSRIVLVDAEFSVTHSAQCGYDEILDYNISQIGVLPCISKALEAENFYFALDPMSSETCSACPFATSYKGHSAETVMLVCDSTVYGWLTVSLPGIWAEDHQQMELIREIAHDIAYALHQIDRSFL